MSERTSRSRSVSSSSDERPRPPTSVFTTSGRTRSARGDALDGADELCDVAHAVLQQVADAGGVVADKLEHVRGLEMLREDEDGDGRIRAADLRGRD